jgi:ABC-type nitrate/sulfonate/bicarbonate transport system permease component
MAGMNGATLSKPAEGTKQEGVFAALHNARWVIAAWAPILVLLIAWEAVSQSGLVTPFSLPAFSAVIERIVQNAATGDLFINVGLTLYRTLVGYVIAAVLGVTLGVAMGRRPLAHWFFDPIISVGFPMPKIAFLPIIVLWLGFFDTSKITMVAFNTIFPIVTATVVGIQGVEKELIWSARALGTSDRRLLPDIILPAALPQILTGLQIALPIALVVDIITEMAMGGYGVGGAMQTASRFADSRGVFAGIIEITVVGYALIKGMSMLRRRLLQWHQEATDPSTA